MGSAGRVGVVVVGLCWSASAAAMARWLPPVEEPLTVATYGDSLTLSAGYPSDLPEPWTVYVEGKYGELGTTGAGRAKYDLVTADLSRMTNETEIARIERVRTADVVTAMWGTNDAGWGLLYIDAVDASGEDGQAAFDANVRSVYYSATLGMVDAVVDAGYSLYFMYPPPWMAAETEGHATLLESFRADLSAELAIRRDEGVDVHEVDVYQAFRDFEADGGDMLSLYASDGGHLSAAGDALVAELLESAIEDGEGL